MQTFERFLVLALLIAELTCRRQLAEQGLRPAPRLSALEVVKIQVHSLQHYNEARPNAGIWTAFQFASPANRDVTGPYGHFLRLIKSRENRAFLNARSVRFSDERRDGSHAEVTVVLEDQEQRSRFNFFLSLQSAGTSKGCWMTDGVRPAT